MNNIINFRPPVWSLLLFALLMLIVLFGGCRTIEVPVPVIKTEIEYRDRIERDTAYVRDSVYIHQKGDTIYSEKYKYIYKEHIKTDTAYVYKCDTITQVISVEKQLTKWQNFKLSVGGFCMTALVVLILLILAYVAYKFFKK